MATSSSTRSSLEAQSEVVQVFEPSTAELPDLRTYLRELKARKAFIVELAKAEVRGPRSSTLIGALWALLDPIFQASIYLFLFVVIRGSSGGARSTEFITAIIFSVFMFNYTRISITDGGRAIIRGKSLMLNAMFPRALLPLSEVYRGVLETIPALGVYVVLLLVLRAPIGPGVAVLPLLFIAQTLINLGLAFLFSTATVFIKDMSNLLNYVVRILLVASPVVYPVATLPPQLRSILAVNPLFPLFSAYQAVGTGNMPSAGLIIQSLIWGVLLLALGAWVFLRHERSLALHL